MSTPCKNCICVPICRHKNYISLTLCSLLRQYIKTYNKGNGPRQLNLKYRCKIQVVLKPSKWEVSKDGYFIDKNGNKYSPQIYKHLGDTREGP